MNWASIGSDLIGSAGDALFGSLLGGGETRGDSMYVTDWTNYKRGEWLNQYAKKTGMHPLYLAGTPAFSSGVSVTGNGRSDAVSNAIGAAKAEARQKKLDDQARKESEQRIQESRGKTQRDLSEAHFLRQKAALDALGAVERAHNASVVGRIADGGNAKQDGAEIRQITKPVKIKNPNMPNHKSNPEFTDTELLEQMYGGLVGEIYGLGRYLGEIGADLGKSLHDKTGKPAQKKRKKRLRKEGYLMGTNEPKPWWR